MIKKLTKSQFSPTHASTKRKITDELKHNAGWYEVREGSTKQNNLADTHRNSNVTDKLRLIDWYDYGLYSIMIVISAKRVLQIGQLYGQFEGSGGIMRQLTINDDNNMFHSRSHKGIFKRYLQSPLLYINDCL